MTVPLPDVYQAELDAATLAQLVSDLETFAEVLEIRETGASRAYGETAPLSLARATERLASGAVRGVQVRYRHEGGLWMDTLMRQGDVTRLVRLRVPDRASGD